jgi:hypothetical protein
LKINIFSIPREDISSKDFDFLPDNLKVNDLLYLYKELFEQKELKKRELLLEQKKNERK